MYRFCIKQLLIIGILFHISYHTNAQNVKKLDVKKKFLKTFLLSECAHCQYDSAYFNKAYQPEEYWRYRNDLISNQYKDNYYLGSDFIIVKNRSIDSAKYNLAAFIDKNDLTTGYYLNKAKTAFVIFGKYFKTPKKDSVDISYHFSHTTVFIKETVHQNKKTDTLWHYMGANGYYDNTRNINLVLGNRIKGEQYFIPQKVLKNPSEYMVDFGFIAELPFGTGGANVVAGKTGSFVPDDNKSAKPLKAYITSTPLKCKIYKIDIGIYDTNKDLLAWRKSNFNNYIIDENIERLLTPYIVVEGTTNLELPIDESNCIIFIRYHNRLSPPLPLTPVVSITNKVNWPFQE